MWPLEHTQVDDGLGTITEVQQLFEHLFLLFFNGKKKNDKAFKKKRHIQGIHVYKNKDTRQY